MSMVNRVNQIWHYPGSVDTVSTVMKIHRVQDHLPIGLAR